MISGRAIIGSSDLAANRPSAADVPDDYGFLATDTGTYSVQSGGSWFDIGGGGGGSTAREQLRDDTGTSVANGASQAISFGASISGTALVDLTDPVNPTIVTTGVYAIACFVAPSTAMTVGGNFDSFLTVDVDGEAAGSGMTSSLATTLQPSPWSESAVTYYLSVGVRLNITITNNDGVAAVTFNPYTVIQRIS